jgi:hypothetical protein
VSELFPLNVRDPQRTEARLANQLIARNRVNADDYGLGIDLTYDRSALHFKFTTSTIVGALPIVSPISGQADYGIVIAPRFDWAGIGQVLTHTGWKVKPDIVGLPALPRSEHGIPPWVISSVVLTRLAALMREVHRAFQQVDEDLSAPRGTIQWEEYTRSRIPAARVTAVPCSVPELRYDDRLLGAVNFVARVHRASLESQRSYGVVVRALLDLCDEIIAIVRHAQPRPPAMSDLSRWGRGAFVTETMTQGLAAMEWTVTERGLAGLGRLEGLPWRLRMESFFESWLETIVGRIARNIGGTVRAGRERSTIIPLRWDPPFTGSQRYLMPDVVLTRPNHTIIFDAKYKRHWDEIRWHGWRESPDALREDHRNDLLQILAYSSVTAAERVTCCLVYPCQTDTWERLHDRGRLWHKADIGVHGRRIELVLCAAPMGAQPGEIAECLGPGLQ